MYLITTTAKESNTSQDYTLVQVTSVSINSNIDFKILWIHASCLLIKDAPDWAQLTNDIDSSLTNTNDLVLTHILLFGQASSDISANTLILNATRKYIISTNRFRESLFLVFCNFLLYFHLFNFFPYPYCLFFFETIHSYSFGFKVYFYLFINIFFTFSFWLYPRASWILKGTWWL